MGNERTIAEAVARHISYLLIYPEIFAAPKIMGLLVSDASRLLIPRNADEQHLPRR